MGGMFLCEDYAVYYFRPTRTVFGAAARDAARQKAHFQGHPNVGPTEVARAKGQEVRASARRTRYFYPATGVAAHGRPAVGAVARGVARPDGGPGILCRHPRGEAGHLLRQLIFLFR